MKDNMKRMGSIAHTPVRSLEVIYLRESNPLLAWTRLLGMTQAGELQS
jgi:hypothetical protein